MAVSQELRNKYTPTIGVETHVQLKTKTKLFSAVSNDARNVSPNTLISHIDVGMPGALPVLNEAAIELCSKAAFVLNTSPQPRSKFERKHYFYPDLPKGYQITQYEEPIILGGEVEISTSDGMKTVKIERANLEEDAGKNTHPQGADYSLVDLNRAGTPLLEIVSQPDIHSATDAKAYARELYLLMRYAGVSDGDLYHGHMRFDVNVSVSNNPDKLGTRSEVKNLNSFRSVEAAITHEIDRQIEILEKGGKIVQETRGWDEAKQKTLSQRSKEEAEDYRYMPEPDIPPVELSDEWIDEKRAKMPKTPLQIRKSLSDIKLEPQVVEDILDRQPIVETVLEVLDKSGPEDARRAVFWLISAEPADSELKDSVEPAMDSSRLIELSQMVEKNELSSTAAKTVFGELVSSTETPHEIAKRLNLLQLSDHSEIEKFVAEVIAENPGVVEDIKAGEDKAIGYLVGQVMSKSKGKANPKTAQQIIRSQLEL